MTNIFNGHTEAVNPTVTSAYTIQNAIDYGNSDCAVNTSGSALVNVTTAISATIIQTEISCAGEADGSAQISSPIGGTEPYTFVWNTGDTGENIIGLASGSYDVTITDADGCSGVESITLTEPAEMQIEVTTQDPLCAGDTNGWISISNVNGGEEPYLFSINNGALQTQDSFPNLGGGAYEILIEDANGCTVSIDQNLTNPSPVFLDLGQDTLVTSGTVLDIRAQTNALITDTIIWSPFEVLDSVFNLTAVLTANEITQLEATLIDENGCTGTDDILIRVNRDRNVFIPTAISPNFDGINDKFVIHAGEGVLGINNISIYDRWGDLIYQNAELELNSTEGAFDGSYDGQMLNDQVLVYVVQLLFTDGRVEVFKGDLTLMR